MLKHLGCLLGFSLIALISACGGSHSSSHHVSSSFSSTASSSANSSAHSSINSSSSSSTTLSGLAQRPSNTSCLAPSPTESTSPATISWVPAFPNLPNASSAISMLQAPNNNNEWYLIRQSGQVLRFENSPSADSFTQVLNIENNIEWGGELGLLGIAFHPQFASNHYVFLNYTARNASGNLESRIARYTFSDKGQIDPESERILLRFNQPYNNHNGGQLAFGMDGYLYIGTGDGGSGGDPQQNGQNTQNLLGKILRIDVDTSTGEQNYTIPADNPFATNGGAPEIWAYGLRNPWRFSFDRESQELWAGDVGQSSWEEINIIRRGGNYGWGDMEGNFCYSGRPNCSTANKILPVLALNQSTGICSMIGGYVYRGQQFPAAYGKYFFSDYCVNTIHSLTRASDGSISQASHGKGTGNIVSFAQDNQGELYALSQSGAGTQIIKMQVTGTEPAPGTLPAQLSMTGCVSADNPQQPAAGMIPYDVQSKLWSDGADKERFLALPDNTQIALAADGDFLFPVGTVLMKHFKLNNRFIETRLFTRGELGWQGFSYEWRDDQSDADLLTGAKEKSTQGLTWSFPSPGQCLICHTQAANYSLGLETQQLNSSFNYPGAIQANQLNTFIHIGLFSSELSPDQQTKTLAAPDDESASLANRARSYLHSNCSGCHRPNGPTPVALDLRYSTPLAASGSCGIAPSAGDMGIDQALIISPGDAQASVLIARMQTRGTGQMPPLGSHLADDSALAVISEWINGLNNCNEE